MSSDGGTAEHNDESLAGPSPWPDTSLAEVLFLLDAEDDFDARLLKNWVYGSRASNLSAKARFAPIGAASDGDELAAALADSTDRWLQPLRIAWLPGERGATRSALQSLVYGRLTQPGAVRKRWIARKEPGRIARIAGDGASIKDLQSRFARSQFSDTSGGRFAEFVVRQALIALERAERVARGARYKVPKLLPGDVFANRAFEEHLATIAQQRDLPVIEVRRDATRYLEEMAATQTPFTLDIMTGLYRAICSSSHDPTIDVRPEQLDALAGLLATRPVAFLSSHKSMLDTAVLCLVLFDSNLPLPLTFGGINLNTPGIGALARRAGVIFLRRSFQDNEVYKATFRRYIDYLIEKRFSLLWALEGTRSRTGKLLPPRFGLFSYVVESILRTELHEVTFVPVSVAYEQITEVEDYAIEQRGQAKKPEGVGWILKFLKRGSSHGRIYLRFGDWLTLGELRDASTLDTRLPEPHKQALVQTLAFEVAVRMNAATPITATAILTLILLAGGTRAQSLAEIQTLARSGAALIRRRKLEIVGRTDFRDANAVKATLAKLHATGIVSYFDEGMERLYGIRAEQHHKAAYYRNTAIHYFVLDALVEISLLDAVAADSDDAPEAFFRRTEVMRELFKFEFYFPRRAGFRAEIAQRAAERFKNWESTLDRGTAAVKALLRDARPLIAHGVLRSFVDAYKVVATVLVRRDPSEQLTDTSAILDECLKLGQQQLLQDRIFSPESISKTLYQTGLKLARHRGLLEAGCISQRQAFLAEFRQINKRLDEILDLTLSWAED